jgi:hypothetical protein
MDPLRNTLFWAIGHLGGLAWHCIGLHAIKAAQPVAQRQVPNVGLMPNRCK